jgi:hypothetical protein
VAASYATYVAAKKVESSDPTEPDTPQHLAHSDSANSFTQPY